MKIYVWFPISILLTIMNYILFFPQIHLLNQNIHSNTVLCLEKQHSLLYFVETETNNPELTQKQITKELESQTLLFEHREVTVLRVNRSF